jgi:hypothetical protein
MIAELLLLQQLLDKTNMVTPPESTSVTTATSTTRGKAETAYNAYKERVSSYLDRFKYRR